MDGKMYQARSGTVVFEKGEKEKQISFKLIGHPTWEVMLEFLVTLDHDNVVGAVVSGSLTSARVKIIGTAMFHGPSAGALDAESPKSKKQGKTFCSRHRRFSYGFIPYFACAEL